MVFFALGIPTPIFWFFGYMAYYLSENSHTKNKKGRREIRCFFSFWDCGIMRLRGDRMIRRIMGNERLPRWMKWILVVLVCLSCVYIAYKLIDGTRAIIHYVTSKEHFWMVMLCGLILVVGTFLVGEYVFDLGWKETLLEFINGKIEFVKNFIREKINSIF